jgi:hypothetical protein
VVLYDERSREAKHSPMRASPGRILANRRGGRTRLADVPLTMVVDGEVVLILTSTLLMWLCQ